ncbi:MAG TPA: class I SAM-dependent methyltransferase [Noviherbaspirillum sp.]|nr:class I SAM-dependent methyltransferase [Noviherbaspirillum sp.]
MNPITALAREFSRSARARRAEIFRRTFDLNENTRILDLGSESGANIHAVLEGTPVRPENVYIADIEDHFLQEGRARYGYVPVLIGESGRLPFPDQFFDIVYCSSVIEHVTVPKEQTWTLYSGKAFRSEALKRQKEFAAEIRRLGKQYYVQTPYRHFPIESHSWLPFVGWLPRPVLIPVLHATNTFWVKKTEPDWYLLDKREMSELFPEARLVDEKSFGFTKSMMAIGARRQPAATAGTRARRRTRRLRKAELGANLRN